MAKRLTKAKKTTRASEVAGPGHKTRIKFMDNGEVFRRVSEAWRKYYPDIDAADQALLRDEEFVFSIKEAVAWEMRTGYTDWFELLAVLFDEITVDPYGGKGKPTYTYSASVEHRSRVRR